MSISSERSSMPGKMSGGSCSSWALLTIALLLGGCSGAQPQSNALQDTAGTGPTFCGSGGTDSGGDSGNTAGGSAGQGGTGGQGGTSVVVVMPSGGDVGTGGDMTANSI